MAETFLRGGDEDSLTQRVFVRQREHACSAFGLFVCRTLYERTVNRCHWVPSFVEAELPQDLIVVA